MCVRVTIYVCKRRMYVRERTSMNYGLYGPSYPPHAGHQPAHTLLWDGIPFFNQHLSQVVLVTLAAS